MEEVISYVKWQVHENLNILAQYDDPDLARITYEIITQWEEQHDLSLDDQGDGTNAMCTSILMFFHDSKEYDNHAWLTNNIAKRSNGKFVI